MNPLLFADWTRIHRLFRGLMWVLAIGLACAVFVGGRRMRQRPASARRRRRATGCGGH